MATKAQDYEHVAEHRLDSLIYTHSQPQKKKRLNCTKTVTANLFKLEKTLSLHIKLFRSWCF